MQSLLDSRLAAFDALSDEEQDRRLREAWETAFIPPDGPGNGTGLWLLPHELSSNVYSCVRIFECFDDLLSAPLFNPARKLGAKIVDNPAIDVAKDSGIDLSRDLESISSTAEGSPELAAVEQRLISLIPAYRQRIKASAAITDQDLLSAICHFEEPVMAEPGLGSLSDQDTICAMRVGLKEHVRECCSDDDLLAAARNPNGPLFASGLCRVQTLHREVGRPLMTALNFLPSDLNRERVVASLWCDGVVKPGATAAPSASPVSAAA
jgi:hypothetical protein